MRIRGPVQIIRSVAVALRDWRRGYTDADVTRAGIKIALLSSRLIIDRRPIYLTDAEFRAAKAGGMFKAAL